MDLNTRKITLYVRLLDEGTEVYRPAVATELGDGLFKLVQIPDYAETGEVWEFPPGSTVRIAEHSSHSETYQIAVAP